jgi:predicted ATPase
VGRPLNQLRAEGFKSIRELDLKLSNLNVLIGANGSGKSNFIGIFRLLNEMVEGRLQLHVGRAGGADRLLHFGQSSTSRMKLDLAFADYTNGYHCSLVPSSDGSLVFESELCWFHDKDRYPQPFTLSAGSGHRESKLRDEAAKERIASYVLSDVQSWRVYHFHDTSDTAKVKQLTEIHDNAVLRPDASNLAAFLYFLKQRHRPFYDNIVNTIHLVAPFFDDFVLRPSPLNDRQIKLEWREKHSDSYFDASSLSDGTLRFICLTTLLLQPTLPSTILLDEPELGLHPYAVSLLSALLKSAATRTQVIVATQSVTLVNQFDASELIIVDRVKGSSSFRRPSSDEVRLWLDEYGVGDLWEKNLLGGRP